MAFPVVAATNQSIVGSRLTSHTVSLPASISAGNLLLIFFTTYGTATHTTPSGWTLLNTVAWTSGRTSTFYKSASGSEGASVSITTSVGIGSSHLTYRITGWDGTSIEASTGVATNESPSGVAGNPDPDNLTPSWGAGHDVLWIAHTAQHGSQASTFGSNPSSYTDGPSVAGDDAIEFAFEDNAAHREVNASSENPGSFTFSVSWADNTFSHTIAISPGASEPNVTQAKFRGFEDGDELPHFDLVTPVIEAADGTGSFNGTASTSWAINFPSGVTGDMFLVLLSWDDSTNTTGVTPPSGPNGETFQTVAGPIASNGTEVRCMAFSVVATGTWSSGTRTFTPSASETWNATVIKIPAGEFNSADPIGAAATRASAGTAETSVLSPAFSAEAGDASGKLVILYTSDVDAITAPGSNFTTIRNDTNAGVGHLAGVRDAAVTASEAITALTATIAGDSWCSLALVVKPPSVADGRTPIAAVNTNFSRDPSDPFGISIRIENAGGVTVEDTYQLEYRLNAGSWLEVNGSSSVIRTVATADFADGADVPEFLTGSGTYVTNNNAALETDGELVLAAVLGALGAFELHAQLEIQAAGVVDDDEIELRIVEQDGTALDAYTVTPLITVTNAGGGAIAATGALAAQSATIAGVVEAIISIDGALASQSAVIAGVAEPIISVDGVLSAQSSVIAGIVEPVISVDGILTSQATSIAGVAEAVISVDGVLQASSSVIEGTYTPESDTISASGALSAQPAIISGVIEAVATFNGTLISQQAFTAGAATVIVPLVFIGTLASPSASISGIFSLAPLPRREKPDMGVSRHFYEPHRWDFKVGSRG